MLPGVATNYQDIHALSRCGIARFNG